MAYNYGFPATYQPYYTPVAPVQVPQPQNNTPMQQGQSGIIWISGEAGAKAYLVAPNTTVQLWDSESQTIFLKSADASGMPSMKILDYTIRGDANTQNMPAVEYATKDEVNALAEKIRDLRDDFCKRRSRLTKEEEDE